MVVTVADGDVIDKDELIALITFLFNEEVAELVSDFVVKDDGGSFAFNEEIDPIVVLIDSLRVIVV